MKLFVKRFKGHKIGSQCCELASFDGDPHLDPDPTFHFDVDPDLDPLLRFTNVEKNKIFVDFIHSSASNRYNFQHF